MKNIIEDISKLTTIPVDTLDKLVEKANWCICDCVKQDLLDNQKISELDIGIGKLFIKNEDELLKYKFVPSDVLVQSLIDTCINKENPLELTLEKKLVNKILNTYKDII